MVLTVQFYRAVCTRQWPLVRGAVEDIHRAHWCGLGKRHPDTKRQLRHSTPRLGAARTTSKPPSRLTMTVEALEPDIGKLQQKA